MKVTVERTPESEAMVRVELDWPEIEAASNSAYKRVAQKYKVHGFRPGHAPRTILERMLGKDAIYQEGLDDLIDAAYRKAIVENDLTPITNPHVDTEKPLEIGEPFVATVHVPVLTPATLGDYKSIRLELPSLDVTDEQVEETVERLRQQQAEWLPVERGAKAGDQVSMDLKLTSEGSDISNLHDNEFVLTDGERAGIFSGMDAHIFGMKEGESKTFTTTIPEDYGNPKYAGKEATYDVTLKAVKERELPEANDEFAMTVGDYTTMDQVRAAIREQLKTQRERDANRDLSDKALKALTESSVYTIHPLLTQDEVDTMVRETKRSLEDSRVSFEDYLAATNKSEEEFRKESEPEATERVKRDLALAALADAEGVTVADDEAGQWFELMSMLTSGRRDRWRDLNASQKRSIIARLRRDKALDRLIAIGTEGKWPPARPTDETATDEATAQANAAAAARAGDEEAGAAAAETAVEEQPAKPAKSGAKGKSAGKAKAAEE